MFFVVSDESIHRWFVPPEVGETKLFTLLLSKRAVVNSGCCLVFYSL